MNYTVAMFSLGSDGREVAFASFDLPEGEFDDYRAKASETLRTLNADPEPPSGHRPTHLRITDPFGKDVGVATG